MWPGGRRGHDESCPYIGLRDFWLTAAFVFSRRYALPHFLQVLLIVDLRYSCHSEMPG
jgi:hypothetical protein